MPTTPRVGARVLLLDPNNRVLLIHARDRDHPTHRWWGHAEVLRPSLQTGREAPERNLIVPAVCQSARATSTTWRPAPNWTTATMIEP